ncbi:D-2-hydroxyacid dehydrogenase [uncultured Endozoicomonas sp.]|uniref:D-2-hydroxyacid dehydrogenase n=1 Tax=uncultured Endozoicomonas sp. TaxID=432652 RepID=UPI0026114935|nr:D-2-hydroxyacid dehydrogenase [uncultured Endozoicomonas sp.]
MINGVFLDAATLGPDLDLTPLHELPVQWQLHDFTQPDRVLERCQNAQIIITNKVVLDGSVLSQLGHLKLICIAATGMNNVDLVTAEQRGIAVKNVTNYGGSSIAQLVFNVILELTTHAAGYNQLVRSGQWSKSQSFWLFDYPMIELAGKTMGLVGYGHLARSVEHLAKAFGMNVLIAEQKKADNLRPGRTPFQQVVSDADIISIHCPLTESTRNLFSEPEFQAMKSSAILVNTARGGIVNEAALVTALNNGDIAGAAVDVITTEPPPEDYPLIRHQPDNLIITPHIAWATLESRARLLQQLVNNIRNSGLF